MRNSAFTATELACFANVCTAIGNESVDQQGFVSVPSLLHRFQADLVVRPLLVEAMIASRDQTSNGLVQEKSWVVLLDKHTHSVTPDQIHAETSAAPLPSRLRNTVAHELVHSLAFRPLEFGIRFQLQGHWKKSQSALVEAVERETERLSPLLLWPENALLRSISSQASALRVEELSALRRAAGISRYLLISRLMLLRENDTHALLEKPALRNMAIGLGQWVEQNTAVLRKWPLFCNFDRNIVPAFILTLWDRDKVPASSILPGDFAACGGLNTRVEMTADAGTAAFPSAEQFTVECAMENGKRRPGSTFLFVVRKSLRC